MIDNLCIIQAAIEKKIAISLPLYVNLNTIDDNTSKYISHYFDLFELPVVFNINQTQLKQAYLNLQTHIHPDKMLYLPKDQQAYALNWAILINDAFQTLKSMGKRALYICKLNHIHIQEKVDVAILQQTMLWYDMLENAENNLKVCDEVNEYIKKYAEKYTENLTQYLLAIQNISQQNISQQQPIHKIIAQNAQTLVMLENFLAKI